MRKPLIVANWKMNKNSMETETFLTDFMPLIEQVKSVEMVICPPFTNLALFHHLNDSQVKLGAQNMFWAEKGAYTGEISASMLLSAGCQYVILGHSERRQLMGENNAIINCKISAAVTAGIIPIMCVGETLQERENHLALQVVKEQLEEGLQNISVQECEKWAIAYEPVWAIGTGINANPDDAQEMAAYIRSVLEKIYDKNIAANTRILYGGSANEVNAGGFFSKEDIDGALVGGASLKPQSFAQIVRLAVN